MATAMTIPAFVPGFKTSFSSTTRLGTYMFDDYGRVYRVVFNNAAAALAIGYACTWDYATASNVGTMVKKPTTATLDRFAGISMGTVADQAEGMIMVKGYHDWVYLLGTTDIAAADSLKVVDGQWYMIQDQATGTAATYKKTAYALEAHTTDTTPAYKKACVDAF